MEQHFSVAEKEEEPQKAETNAEKTDETLSKKKAKKAQKIAKKIKVVPGSVDVRVQHTNDDSVVSKRSAVAMNYFHDPFLRHFVKKPTRRAPLINRGYYLRMLVMTDVVTQAINHLTAIEQTRASSPTVQIISLGAGYDTFAFRHLLAGTQGEPHTGPAHAMRAVCAALRTETLLRLQFFDVDFPAVMQAKASLMAAAPRGAFDGLVDLVIDPSNASHPVRSGQYNAVGVDLRKARETLLPRLAETAPTTHFSPDLPTVVYAECVMQYMPAEAARELIAFVAHAFPDAVFISYDQLHPGDSFGGVMLHSLKQKNSPLLGIDAAPDGKAMTRRAREAGMASVFFANFHKLTRYHITAEEERRLKSLEAFDELEEWAEMCEHYGITLAFTSAATMERCVGVGDAGAVGQRCAFGNPAYEELMEETPTSSGHAVAARAATAVAQHQPWPSSRFGFEGWGHGDVFAEAHPTDAGETVIIAFGGFCVAGKPVVGGERVLVAHWSRLQSVGGRASEPPARFRHSAVALPGAAPRLFLFGGCDASTRFNDAWIGIIDTAKGTIAWSRWEAAGGDVLPAVCAASLVVMPEGAEEGSSRLLLSGGLDASGRCSRDAFLLLPEAHTCAKVPHFSSGVPLLGQARFAHTVTPVDVDGISQLLILGGCTSDDKGADMASTAVLVDASLTKPPVRLCLPAPCPVALARHAVVRVASGVVAVVGGGYTCFSFGTFTSRPFLLCLGQCYDKEPSWMRRDAAGAPPDAAAAAAASRAGRTPTSAATFSVSYPAQMLLALPRSPVEERAYTPEAFLEAVTVAAKPIVFRRVNMGPCVDKWCDPAYLRRAEKDAVVSVHVANAKGNHLLDFVRKNFTFRHVAFPELVAHVEESGQQLCREGRGLPADRETWYFRSVANNMKTERANLWTDFPNLGKDFELPAGAREHVMSRLHQCCLRLNAAPLQLWMHYDTFDNVLCQVVGHKRVVLFPPSEYGNLYMSGSSSPVLNIDCPDLQRYPRFIDACKRAVEVVLEPGDLLYFPANWFHHITTLMHHPGDVFSISVNAFFAYFDETVYDRKDLYGNKDIPAVVQLRQKINALVRDAVATQHVHSRGDAARHHALPAAYAQFALRQAIQDLEKLADEMSLEASGAMS